DGGVKILDFGIAKVESTSVTRAGMMVGTPYYMSPEHIRGSVLDGRSDVFAVGVILHELFAGARPFIAEDSTRVMYRIVNEAHSRLDPKAAGSVTADIQRIIDKSLEKDADARFTSATQMADELTRVRDRYPVKELNDPDSSALSRARKSLTARQVEANTLQTVERIAGSNPDSSEAQRLLRLIKRKPDEPHAVNVTGSFPELDATFGRAEGGDATATSGKTISGSAATLLQGGGPASVVVPEPAPESNKLLYSALAICLMTGAVAGFLYFKQRNTTAPSDPRPTPTMMITEIIVPASNGATPRRTVTAPTPEAPSLTGQVRALPAPAIGVPPVARTPVKVAVPGAAGKVAVESRSRPPGTSIRMDRRPEGPPSTFLVESAYPVTITVDGRVLASNKAGASATLSAGAHEVAIESAAVFLKKRESVQLAPGGSLTLRTPGTGKIGVRANPDNCKVFVDGVFLDYPPILDRVIAAGNHVVSFEWPDGSRSEEKVEIQSGKPGYVMGRKP
ncbi:MAG: protein kinase, partial [Vicinamibacteria bacterium]